MNDTEAKTSIYHLSSGELAEEFTSGVPVGPAMSDVTVHRLVEQWEQSHVAPLALFERTDPDAQVGSYVIEPGERVPKDGMTSHDGDEVSVILSGEIDLVAGGDRRSVGPESLTVIPAGTPHYSENTADDPVRLVYAVLGEL